MQEAINFIMSWPLGLRTVLSVTLMMYFLHICDVIFFKDRIKDAFSVIPRRYFNPFRFFLSPFVHKDRHHLFSNTIPFIVLGSIIAVRDPLEFWYVTMVVALVDGLFVWVFGSVGYHLGASGLIMGYFSYILARGIFNQNVEEILIALAMLAFFGFTKYSFFGNLRFRRGSSNVGHWFGFLGGIGAAYIWVPLVQQQIIY